MLNEYTARLYRIVFSLAAVYNLVFGLWAMLWPGAFFDLFGMVHPHYPAIWQCLGMVIGLYGVAYGYAVFRLDRARPFVAIGLAGKVIGPIGWLATVSSGQWPLRTFPLIVFNDLVWWLPFSLFLLEGTRFGAGIRRSAPYICAALNAFASVALLLALRGGTEVVPDISVRVAYISEHPILWRGGWALWMAAALSLLAFYAWWGARLPQQGWGVSAFVIAAAGLTCDLLAESLYIGWLPGDLERIQPLGSILTGGAANGLYTVAGVILTLGTKALRGGSLALTWIVWMSGFGLSAATLAGSVVGMVASAAILMILFCPWAALMGWKLGRGQLQND